MKTGLVVLLQVVLTVLVAGAVMPIILFSLPEARAASLGRPVLIAVLAFVFVLIRLVWPKRVR